MINVPMAVVKARLKLWPTSAGGPSTGIRTEESAVIAFDYIGYDIQETFEGKVQFDSPPMINPGEEAIVSIRFIPAPELKTYLKVGTKGFIHQGSQVGEVEILKV